MNKRAMTFKNGSEKNLVVRVSDELRKKVIAVHTEDSLVMDVESARVMRAYLDTVIQEFDAPLYQWAKRKTAGW